MEDVNLRYYDFGEFRVDSRRGTLTRSGEIISLTPRNFDLLLVLIANEGRMLEHDELLDKVWAGTFVEPANLKNAISVLRRILGESPDEANYIRTIPRRGYCFVAEVRGSPDDVSTPELDPALIGADDDVRATKIPVDPDQNGQVNSGILTVPTMAGPVPKSKRSTTVLLFGSLFVIALVIFGAWRYLAKEPVHFSLENITINKLTSRGNLNGAVVSSDGNYFVYAEIENDGASLWVQQIATGSATRLTPKMQASFWFYGFSADNNYIFYTVNNNSEPGQNGLFKIPLFGGSPQRVSENASGCIFSPDGTRIAVVRPGQNGGSDVITANPDFTDEKQLASFSDEFRIWSMNWSPDGKALLFALRKFTSDTAVHYVVEYPIDGSKERLIVPEMEKQITGAVWQPDKNSLLLCLRELNAEIRQIWQYFPATREFRRVTNDNNSYKNLSSTRDGRSIVSLTENRYASVWAADDEKYDLKQVTSGASHYDGVQWTADGRMIYNLVENSDEAIYIMNPDGSQIRKITDGNDGIWLYPRVSSDGKSVLYASSRTGRRQLWRIDLDGRNLIQLTHSNETVEKGKLLSDNRTAIFQGDSNGKSGFLFKQIGEDPPVPLISEKVDVWDVSPDEKLLAYVIVDQQTRRSRVYVRYLESDWPFKSFDIQPFQTLRWTRDGKGIAYDVLAGDSSAILLQPIEGGEARNLAKLQGERIFSFDWSFDGKRLSVVRGRQLSDAVQIKIASKN